MRGIDGEGFVGGGLPAPSVADAMGSPAPLDVVAVTGALAECVGRGLAGFDGAGLLGVAQQARAVSAWVASVELEAVSRLLREQTREAEDEVAGQGHGEGASGPGVKGPPPARAVMNGWDWTVTEVACAFRLTTRQAEGRVNLALTLRNLPGVHALLRAGQVDEYRARVIAETLSASSLTPADPAWAEVADLACSKAPERTHTQIRRHLTRLLLKIDPGAAACRRAKALAGREVCWWPEPDGMATLQAKISGETAAIIDTALSALADAARDHQHQPGVLVAATHQERRADAFGEVFRSILEGRSLRFVQGSAQASASGTATPGAAPAGAGPESAGPESAGPAGAGPESTALACTAPEGTAPEGTAPEGTAEGDAALADAAPRAAPGAAAGRAESTSGAATFSPENPGKPAWSAAASGSRVPAWWVPPDLPTRKGRRPHLIVTIAETTLDGQDEVPAELAGYGPIPAEVGRQMARQAGTRSNVLLPRPGPAPSGQPPPGSTAGSSIGGSGAGGSGIAGSGDGGSGAGGSGDAGTHRLEADSATVPDGAAGCTGLNCGTDRYTPGRALIDAVIATYPTCQAPGCTRASIHCDVDHVIPYRRGGRTCRHNLRPLCRRHHRLKTHAGWRREPGEVGKHPPGTVIWTTRLGRRHAVPPPDRPGSPEW